MGLCAAVQPRRRPATERPHPSAPRPRPLAAWTLGVVERLGPALGLEPPAVAGVVAAALVVVAVAVAAVWGQGALPPSESALGQAVVVVPTATAKERPCGQPASAMSGARPSKWWRGGGLPLLQRVSGAQMRSVCARVQQRPHWSAHTLLSPLLPSVAPTCDLAHAPALPTHFFMLARTLCRRCPSGSPRP